MVYINLMKTDRLVKYYKLIFNLYFAFFENLIIILYYKNANIRIILFYHNIVKLYFGLMHLADLKFHLISFIQFEELLIYLQVP